MQKALAPWYQFRFGRKRVFRAGSRYASERLESLRQKIANGETAYLAGISPAGHNSGVALIEVSPTAGIRLLGNDEEERFTGVKHFAGYPEQSIELLKRRLAEHGLTPSDIHAWLAGWDYVAMPAIGLRSLFEHFPRSLGLLRRDAMPDWDFSGNGPLVRETPKRLAAQLGLAEPVPLIAMPHHDNHAAFSYAASPFARDDEPVMITVLDGFGDEGAISTYVVEGGQLKAVRKNHSLFDSLGLFYSIISSTQGGWTTLSSEGRYMGAAAWGDRDRTTNPYYKQLRQIFHFGPSGRLDVNRAMAGWHLGGLRKPYCEPLRGLLGDPIAPDQMWNPDRVLNVAEVRHSTVTRDRVDIAAATQLVFEDAVTHIVDGLIRETGSRRLVMTGGTALNCVANMHLLDQFNRDWYRRNLGQDSTLHLWVPPIPGDAGAPAGAAYNFALAAGTSPGKAVSHAFYCGLEPTTDEIESSLADADGIEYRTLGNVDCPDDADAVADLMAFIISRGGVLGLFQGVAETGPRALGHRSIVANPCDPATLENINRLVKCREPIRPLAPMTTLAAAREYFDLAEGASDDEFNAYNYMVLTARAKPHALRKIPAVIHRDNTARVQIVRPETDPFTFAFLKAMRRHVGVEVAVNTSLNVGSPIVQTPAQAIDVLHRAIALSGLVLVASNGDVRLAWNAVPNENRDGGEQLNRWFAEWSGEEQLTAETAQHHPPEPAALISSE